MDVRATLGIACSREGLRRRGAESGSDHPATASAGRCSINVGMEDAYGPAFVAVVAARFLVPLLIPRYPLPVLLASMILDAADRELFELVTSEPLEGYQGYDKALDTFYLSIAMLAALRNWASFPAVRIARFLLYYRLVGVALFELTGWRPLLVIFPNTFEYFFIVYELIVVRWSAARLTGRRLLVLAAGIWLLVKLPQEYWIHILKRDVTEELAQLSTRVLLGGSAVLVVAAVGALLIARRHTPAPDHPSSLRSPPLPPGMEAAPQRARFVAARWHVVDLRFAEKVWLTTLLTVIFAQIVPGVVAPAPQLAVGVSVVVGYSSFLRLNVARRGRSIDSAVATFVLLLATNVVWVYAAASLLHDGSGRLQTAHALFFLSLLSLIVTMYDRWRPVCELRHDAQHHEGVWPIRATRGTAG